MAKNNRPDHPDVAAVNPEVVQPGFPPPCLTLGTITCRSCPGWSFMLQAFMDPSSGWAEYPIHCSATGLTVCREKKTE